MIWSSNSSKFSVAREDKQCITVRCLAVTLCVLLAACVQPPVFMASQSTGAELAVSLAQGWRILFDQRLGNCTACHSIPDEQGRKLGIQSTFAPALDGVASRYSAVQLRQWVVDARQLNPDTLMPPFGAVLSHQQVTDVLAALQTLR
jgi:sulfur oxidation c-type cytochrome SoxX